LGEPILLATRPKGTPSVAHVTDDWYVVATSRELRRDRPLAVVLYDTPIVLYREASGRPAALLDRCPHRNVPLRMGRVEGDRLQCAYHGWQFDRTGACVHVPSLVDGAADAKARRVPSFACREEDGVVWIYATPDTEPVREPFRFPYVHERGYTTVIQRVEAQGSLHAVAENALDVPHTAFLHRGLFRTARAPNRITAVVRRWHDRVEAEYVGEPRPSGLAGRILAPRGGVVTHFDRFILPCIAQVEYKLGSSHFCVSAALTPVSDHQTRLFSVTSFKLPIPGWLVVPFLKPIALKIFGQDASMLRLQSENVTRFGGEQYATTEIDVLGPHILRLLRSAERGDRTPTEEPFHKELQLDV
jgi:phenylpropionate dioxygenase-like ring-hydroxylating dioxygenase large terminal subunit